MKKRILSIILSIVMLVGLLPTTALASSNGHPGHTCSDSCGHENSDPHRSGTWTAWDGTSSITQSGNYYLSGDSTPTYGLTIGPYSGSSIEVTLCLNGNTLNVGSEYIHIRNARVTLCDCSVDESGLITGTGS